MFVLLVLKKILSTFSSNSIHFMDIDDEYKHQTAYLQLPKRQVESMDQVFDLTVTSTRLNLQNFQNFVLRTSGLSSC
jgi:hypothetical protein